MSHQLINQKRNQNQNHHHDHKSHHNIELEDLDHLNPDWQFASDHGKSIQPGKKKSQIKFQQEAQHIQLDNLQNNSNSHHRQLCRCCLNQIQKQEIPLMQNTKELDVIGFGFPIYFSFLRNCLLLLFVMIISYNAMELYAAVYNNSGRCSATTSYQDALHIQEAVSNHIANDVSQSHFPDNRLLASSTQTGTIYCYTFMIKLSSINFEITQRQLVLRLVTFIAILITLLYIRQKQNKLDNYFDEKTTSLSDFAIMINNLPENTKGIQKTVRDFFLKQFKKPHEIKQITLIPYLSDFIQIKEQKHHLVEEKKKMVNSLSSQNQNSSLSLLDDIDIKINAKQAELISYCQNSREKAQRDQMLTEKMILVFDTDQQKQIVLEQFKQIEKQVFIRYFGEHGDDVQLTEAPQPKEIIWQNINYPKKKRYLRIFLGWIFSILFVAAVTVVFYFVLVQKSKLLQQALYNYKYDPVKYQGVRSGAISLVYILLILIIIFNKHLLGFVLHKFTLFEFHGTTSSLQFSFALKYSCGLFFTTALMTLAVQAFTFENYYSHEYGVIEQQTVMFFLNGFFVPIIWFVNPWHIFKMIKRRCYYGSPNLTQEQANHIMQLTPYDMGKRLAQILQTMWFTFLYAPIIPLGAFLSFAGLIFYYWIDKYNLLRRCSVTRHISAKLLRRSLTLLDLVLLLYSVGSLLFDLQIKHTYHWSSIVYIVLSFIYLIIPWDAILNFFFDQKFDLEQKTFTEVKENFIDNYHTMHPIRRALYLKKFLNEVNSPKRKKTTLKNYSRLALDAFNSTQKMTQHIKINQFKNQNGRKVSNLNQTQDHINISPAKMTNYVTEEVPQQPQFALNESTIKGDSKIQDNLKISPQKSRLQSIKTSQLK